MPSSDKLFDKTKDEAALLICFLFDHSVQEILICTSRIRKMKNEIDVQTGVRVTDRAKVQLKKQKRVFVEGKTTDNNFKL
jgi:hypothetical protein